MIKRQLTSQDLLASHESGQKVILTARQSNHLLATINGMMFYIHTQIAVRRWDLHLTTMLVDKVPTSENRLNTSHQLINNHWLIDVRNGEALDCLNLVLQFFTMVQDHDH